jgi:hypothetical protein
MRHYLHAITYELLGATFDNDRTRLLVSQVASDAAERLYEAIVALVVVRKSIPSVLEWLPKVERGNFH